MTLPNYTDMPRSVRWLDKLPPPAHKFRLGSRFYQVVTYCRDTYSFYSTGAALLNELRTIAGTVRTLANELRARIHTAGDLEVLLVDLRARAVEIVTLANAIRGELITGGQLQARLQDLEDKAFNALLNSPGWAQDGGVATDFENVNPVNAVVDGSYRLSEWVDLLAELRARIDTAGDLEALLVDLRARMVEVGALDTEIRARLDTAGDYQALLSAIRAELIANGEISDILIDIHEKAYNQILTDPGWAQDGGVNTDFENVNQIDAIINGSFYANIVAAATNYSPTSPAWDTIAGEERWVTMSVTAAGVVHATISPAAPTGTGVIQRCPYTECPIGLIYVPASFTGGVSLAGLLTFTDGFPRRLAIYTPMVTADVAAIVAPAPTAMTAPDIAVVAAGAPVPLIAGGTNITPVGWDTGAAETRLVTLSVNAAGVVTQTVSAIGALEAPRPPSGECPIGVVAVPANFTSGVSATGLCTFVQGFPRRLAVHTPIATAAVTAMTAPNIAAIAGAAIAAVTEPAVTPTTATIPDTLPNTDAA